MSLQSTTPALFALTLAALLAQGCATRADTTREPAAEPVRVQLLATNDFHGNLEPPSGSSGRIRTGPSATDTVDAGGAEYLATLIASLRAENPNTITVAAGDVIGASPLLSSLFHDEPTIESMNALGLDVTAVGNHELDEGTDELLRMQRGGCHPTAGCFGGDGFDGAAFDFLAANVIHTESGEPLLPGTRIIERGGVRIGFIGLTLEGTPAIVSPSSLAGYRVDDEAETINRLVPGLLDAGVATVVVLLHEGLVNPSPEAFNGCDGVSGPASEISEKLDPAVSVLITGHTHNAYICRDANRLITSAASFGRLVTDIDLVFAGNRLISAEARNVVVTRDRAADPAQTALIARYDALAAPMANRVVGRAASDILRAPSAGLDSPLGGLIADAQLSAQSPAEGIAGHVAFMNLGGVRGDLTAGRVSGGEQPGEITYEEAFTVQPFGNLLVSMTLTGAQLVELLESQWRASKNEAAILTPSATLHYTWSDTPGADGRRATGIHIEGRPLDEAASYRVTVSSFLAEGGDGFTAFKAGTARKTGGSDVDAFTAWLGAHSPVAPPSAPRVTRR
jgi:5'-nucleotidase